MPRARSNLSPAPTGSSAPKRRKTTAQGNALGSRPPMNPSPEGAAQKGPWIKMTLGEMGHWFGGGTPSKARADFWTNGDIPWVSPKDMKTPKIRDAQDHITEAAVKGSSTSLVPAGSVLVVVRSGILKHTLPVAITEREVALNQDLKAITPNENVLTEYLALGLKAFEKRILDECCKDGTTVQNIKMPSFLRFALPVPPLTEQRRIVARIEELFSRLDAGVAALRHAKAQLQRYRQSVLAAAVTGQLTQEWREQHGLTMENWRQTTLGDESSLVTSGSRGWAKYYADDGPLFVRAQNIKTDALVLDDLAHVRPPAGSEGARTQVFENDLLITITGANVTKSALVKQPLGEAYVSQHVALVRPVNPDHAPFLYYAIVSPRNGRAFLEEQAYGAGKPGLNLTNVKEVPIGLPPLAEQYQIVAEVEARNTAIDHLEAELDRQITRSNRLRQATLRSAFTGCL